MGDNYDGIHGAGTFLYISFLLLINFIPLFYLHFLFLLILLFLDGHQSTGWIEQVGWMAISIE